MHWRSFNPAMHGLVANVEDWRYSSFRRDTTASFVPTDGETIDGEFGEREGP